MSDALRQAAQAVAALHDEKKIMCQMWHLDEVLTAFGALRAALAEPVVTGWEGHMLQDCSRELSRALANKPDAMLHAREAAAALAEQQPPQQAQPESKAREVRLSDQLGGLGPERAAFERWLLRKYPGTVLDRDEFNGGRYKSFDVRVAWEAWCERAVARGGSRRFAGWFGELPSGMSYRLWEHGRHEPDGDDVALYEA